MARVNFHKCHVFFLTWFLSFIHGSGFPVWSLRLLRDFQLQQVNKLQKTLLIIAGTFHRYSEISMMIHCSQGETHIVSSSFLHSPSQQLAIISKADRVVFASKLLNRLWPSRLNNHGRNNLEVMRLVK